jgi:predicted metal-dependent hydrolase
MTIKTSIDKIIINDEEYEIQIERKKVRSLRLMIYPTLKLKLVVPKQVTDLYIHQHINSKRNWIEKHIMKFKIQQNNKEIEQNNIFRFLGNKYLQKIVLSDKNTANFENNEFVIFTSNKSDLQIQDKLTQEFLLNQVPSILNPIIDKYLKLLQPLNLTLNQVVFRTMKSRWGSCTKLKKKITLNTNLLHEPVEFIEYVVLHELCHLKYPNHRPQFYHFLEQFMPDWKERKKLIKQ